MTAFAAPTLIEHVWPPEVLADPGPDAAGPPGTPDRRLVLFVGGSKDGQTLLVPFVDGGVCVCIEMPPQVVLRRDHAEAAQFEVPILLEHYVQHTTEDDGREFAVSLDLRMSRYCEEVELTGTQLSVDAVHQLRSSIRAHVADVGGRILAPATGREDVCVELVVTPGVATFEGPRRVLRGVCWLVAPA